MSLYNIFFDKEEKKDQPKISTLPSHLGGGSYYIQPSEPGKLITTQRDLSTSLKNLIRGGSFVETEKEVDHIIPKFLGGTDEVDNLQALQNKKSFFQKTSSALLGKEYQASQYATRQAGKYDVEIDVMRRYNAGEIDLGEARREIQEKTMEIQGIIPKQGTTAYLGQGYKDTMINIGDTVKNTFADIGERLKDFTLWTKDKIISTGQKVLDIREKIGEFTAIKEEDIEWNKYGVGVTNVGLVAMKDPKTGKISAIDPIGAVGSMKNVAKIGLDNIGNQLLKNIKNTKPNSLSIYEQVNNVLKIGKNNPINKIKSGIDTAKTKAKTIINSAKEQGIALITKADGTQTPAIRKSGVFATEDWANFNFKDIKGLLGGRTYNINDALLAFDNITPQQAAKTGWGPGAQLSFKLEAIQGNKINFLEQKANEIKKLADSLDIKINKQTGKQIFEALEGKTDLPENIITASKVIRETLDNLRLTVNQTRTALGKKEIGYIDNYAPHLQDTSFWRKMLADTRTTITDAFDYIIPNAKRNPHALRRTDKLTEVDQNAWELLERYFSSSADDMFTTPVIEEVKVINSVLKSREMFKMSNFLETYIKENVVGKASQIDNFFGLGIGTKSRAVVSEYMKARNIAALSGNLRWIFGTMPATTVLTMARGGGATKGLQNFLGGIKDFAFNSSIKTRVKGLPITQVKFGGKGIGKTGMGDLDNIGARIYKRPLDKVNNFLSNISDSMEYWLTGSAAATGFRRAKQLGLKGKNADIFANWLAGATQSRYSKEARPIILNSVAIRALKPFQTYANEMYRYTKTLVGAGGGMPLTVKDRINQSIILLTGMYAYNKYSQAVYGTTINTIGSGIPLAGQKIDQLIEKGREAVGMSGREVSGRVPDRETIAPIGDLTAIIDATKTFVKNNNIQPLRKEFVRWSMGFTGVGGATTINRLVDGMIANVLGYQPTKTGDVAFPIETTKDKIIAPILGPYSTEEGKKYIEQLGKSKTQIKIEELEKMNNQQFNQEMNKLKEEEPRLFKLIETEYKWEQIGITKEERELNTLSASEKPSAIAKYIANSKDPQLTQRKLQEAGILTDKILKEIKELFK
jgi:hypothetical protein